MTCSKSEVGCAQTPGNMVGKKNFLFSVIVEELSETGSVMIIAVFSIIFEHLCNTD